MFFQTSNGNLFCFEFNMLVQVSNAYSVKKFKIVEVECDESAKATADECWVYICEYYSANENIFTWPCAEVLSMYILRNKQLFTGKRILELGCGTALPSLVLAKCCGVTSVIATERPELKASQHMYSIIHENILINGLAGTTVTENENDSHSALPCARKRRKVTATLNSSRIFVRSFKWGEHDTKPLVGEYNGFPAGPAANGTCATEEEVVDIIIGADVLYSMEDCYSLLSSVDAYMRRCPGVLFIMTYQERSSHRVLTPYLDLFQMTSVQIELGAFMDVKLILEASSNSSLHEGKYDSIYCIQITKQQI